ncbi:hypothetical protein C4D60_Mb01t12580 [Musa balbisiana]|uniref:Uncharacterized protein n=1 Tax=Musa balbisiana TaxID=52838 RepID=A0A4S8JM24_MUSBA|nr:hypothetical protein C4D60_Mb01t12580 [Musa balbisiana]
MEPLKMTQMEKRQVLLLQPRDVRVLVVDPALKRSAADSRPCSSPGYNISNRLTSWSSRRSTSRCSSTSLSLDPSSSSTSSSPPPLATAGRISWPLGDRRRIRPFIEP